MITDDGTCAACGAEVLDVDVKCGSCGAALSSTGSQRMIGGVILGQYEVVDVLGQGGMSVVYKGVHKITQQEVALKILPPELAAYRDIKARFLEEARALAQLDHPNIVHLYNFGDDDGCLALAMQFVRGQTWERLILTRGRLPWQESARISSDVLAALEYAHGRGIVHRDMKPSNVLIREDDGSATVMDFGIAKMTTSSRLTATGQTMGTVRYMSPEQVRGQSVDHRSDIYSLSATLYESVVGDTPFDGETHFEIMSKHLSDPPVAPRKRGVEIPQPLEALILAGLKKNPAERPGSAREMREVVIAALEGRKAPALISGVDVTAPAVPSRKTGAAVGPVDTADMAGPRTGSLRWVVLGVVTVAAAAVAAFFLFGRGDSASGARTSGASGGAGSAGAQAAPVDAADPWPEVFSMPGTVLSVDERFADDQIRVACAVECSAEQIREWVRSGRDSYLAFLAQRKVAAPELGSVNVLVLENKYFCDPRLYEESLPEDCNTSEVFYRVSERTIILGATSQKPSEDVAYAVALNLCMHSTTSDCNETLEDYMYLLRERR